eukprot:Nitzschia sp. Nitz4//scaffold30_size153850//32634//33824//NITZ4_002765-RA/size153850-processed-gene-0.207-mRNA-1//-1//CDS//3329547223//894//frame0
MGLGTMLSLRHLMLNLLLLGSCFCTQIPDGIDALSGSVLKVYETEQWDIQSNSWKATSEVPRWSNELGESSLSPSEVLPPPGFDFGSDWKIVLEGSDAMGWEYTFRYLQPPVRRRVWLRGLHPMSPPLPHTLVVPEKLVPKTPNLFSRTIEKVRDSYNFKGYYVNFYKSLVSWESFGFGVGCPLTMNFDLWDRNPGLPSLSTSLGFYFPWTVAAFLSTSVHFAWVRWVVKMSVVILPYFLTRLAYRYVVPTVWVLSASLLLPLGMKIPPIPEEPILKLPKPYYNSEISERMGCSFSYRWSLEYGFEKRFNYWHSYRPTFSIYRKFLGMNNPIDWWQQHFGSFGLSTGYPLPRPPHYSCSLNLGLSGLYFQSSPPPASREVVIQQHEENNILTPTTS